MKYILVTILLTAWLVPTQALAETRLGFGLGWSFCDESECNDERTTGWAPETVQYLLEQRLTRDIYIQARAETNWWMYGSMGVHVKYLLPTGHSSTQNTGLYVRGGIHRYNVDLDRFIFFDQNEREKFDGTSYSLGLGWQHYSTGSWGITGELFLNDFDRYQAYGAMLTLSYRFGASRF